MPKPVDPHALKQGDQIAKVPPHVAFNPTHPDIEFGFVMMTMVDGAFCRYWRRGEPGLLRTVANSEKTPYEWLVRYDSVPQKVVTETINKIWGAILNA